MKKKFFGFLTAILTLGVLGGTAFVAASDNIQKEESAYAVTMTGGEVLYLKPNSNWTTDGARFAIYVFGSGEGWASMTQCEWDAGTYKATVPNGSWTNVIFCRMNGDATENNWDNKWTQTGDLTYDGTKNLYTINAGSWDAGTWSKFEENLPSLSIASADGWIFNPGDETNLTYGVDKGEKPASVTWSSTDETVGKVDENTGAVNFLKAGTFTINVKADGYNDGEYGFTVTNLRKEMKLFLKPNSNWTSDGARFAAYFFGNGETWVDMTQYGADGIYEVTTPSDKLYTTIIFCRMNGDATENNWDNKWTQTGDLTYDGTNNLYTIEPADTWDQGSWSLFKTDEMVVDEFVATYMHMTDITHNPNDNDTEECKGNDGYYALAKQAFKGLTADQKELFATGGDYANAWARLNAWAKANGEKINDEYEFVKPSNVTFLVQNNNLYVFIIIAIGAISLVVLFYAIKRKRQTI